MSKTPFQHLQSLCWNSTIWFGEWPSASVGRRLGMCRDMTEMYLDFRRHPREEAEPWVWEAIDALHVELSDLIAQSLPDKEHNALMMWIHNSIHDAEASVARMKQQLDECPF